MILRALRHIALGPRPANTFHHHIRPLITSPLLLKEKPLPPRPKIPEDSLEEKFLKGTGPGGQKINKTSSAVQLKHLPTGIVVKYQGQRSREFNRKHARLLLAEKLDQLEKGDQSRTAIKEEIVRRKKASKGKKARRKYRALEEGKEGGDGEEVDEVVDEPEEAVEGNAAEEDVTKSNR